MSVGQIEQVLAQIRTMSAQAAGNPEAAKPPTAEVDFGNLLQQSIDSVNQTQVEASEMKQAFELGSGDASLAEVMIAVQKSGLAFQSMLQVRNKLVDAYKEVMNMPL